MDHFAAIAALLEENGLDAMLLTEEANRFYATGFHSIGTDGCASSNNLDMLEAMKTTAIFQKAWRKDPSALPLQTLMEMATSNGAAAFGLHTGRIEEGYDADIQIVDTDNTFFLSPGPFLANFIYSAHSDCVDSLICRGKFLMRNRKVAGERGILDRARDVLDGLR